MRDNKKYGQVFSATVDLNVWVPIAILIKKTDKFLAEIRKEMDKNVVKFLKNYRHIAMFITVARLMGTFAFNEQQLIKMDLELYTKEEVEKSLVDL